MRRLDVGVTRGMGALWTMVQTDSCCIRVELAKLIDLEA